MAFETTICQECPTPIQWPNLRAAYLRCINIALDTRDAMLKDRDARIADLESQLKAMTAERDAQAEAVRVLGRGVLAGQLARARMRECPSTSGGAGGQTVEACLSRMRFHQVPLSIFDDLYAAEEMIHDNPIAAAAVKGGGG